MISNIQTLRAIAAYMVVIHHLREYLHNYAGIYVDTNVGEAGVDIFFVISGFIMVAATKRETRPLSFLWRRSVRIAPFYWCMTSALFLIAMVAPSILGSTQGRWDMFIKSLLFIPFEKAPKVVMPVLYVGWTLNFEMFFYLLFSCSLLCRSLRSRVSFLGASLVLLVVMGRVFEFQNVIVSFFTNPLLLEFLVGSLLGAYYVRARSGSHPRAKAAGVLLVLFGTAGLVTYVVAGINFPDPLSPFRPLYWGIPCAMIVAGAVSLELGGHTTRNRILISQGDASYSVYLTHLFVLHFSAKLFGVVVGDDQWLGLVLSPLVLAAVAAVGWAVHAFFERPLNQWLRSALA